MTVTTNEYGQQNLFAREPQMYVDSEEIGEYSSMSIRLLFFCNVSIE
jgi:hypothetical protein